MRKIVVHIDLDDTVFDYKGAIKAALEKDARQPYPQSGVHFFYNLQPIEGAVEVVNWLFNQPDLDVWFLTAPSIKNPLCYTEKRLSLDKWFGSEIGSRIGIHPNKGLVKGDFLIDDIDCGKGQENFEGSLLRFGSAGYENWYAIKDHFEDVIAMNQRGVMV